MVTTQQLVMTFLTGVGRKVSLSLDNPREDINEAEVVDAMNLILEKNIFAPYGSYFESAVEAKVVCTDTTEYDLVM